jgi:hypothetical protein
MALFTKGQSGNPSGRTVGSRNQINVMRDALKSYNNLNGVNATEAIVHKIVDLALIEGDMGAAKLILERTAATVKPVSTAVTLPADMPKDLFQKGERILELIASGDITSDIGKELLASITMLLKVKEVTELETRLAELEQGKSESAV